MTATLLDGRALAEKIKDDLRAEIAALKQSTGTVPHLVNVIIGDDEGSSTYAKSQKKTAEGIGINYELLNLPKDTAQEELEQKIIQLNQDKSVHGIMIHKPVPDHIDYGRVANHVDIDKDLEGINVANIGKMLLGKTNLIPCTPAAVMELIRAAGDDIRGKEVVVVGASEIVGKPLSLLLLQEMATVTVCHIATSEAGKLVEHIGRADVLIVAVGKAGLIKGEWIKEGATVIDVGINAVNGKIVGDVEFEQAQNKAKCITPVPGGVGPVTVVMLMRNGVEAFKSQAKEN